MPKPLYGKRAVRGPKIRLVKIVPRKTWDGYCPDCRRGADGLLCVNTKYLQVWCDCRSKRTQRTRVVIEVHVDVEHGPVFGQASFDVALEQVRERFQKIPGVVLATVREIGPTDVALRRKPIAKLNSKPKKARRKA